MRIFQNTVLESLACGTPAVGFGTGGVVDAVEHGVTGMLAPTGNAKELAACIVRCYRTKSFENLWRAPQGLERFLITDWINRQRHTLHSTNVWQMRDLVVTSKTN